MAKRSVRSKARSRAKTRVAATPGPAAKTRARAKSRRATGKRWSHHVMETSDALDLEPGVFAKRSAKQIALSLKRSAEASRRRKAAPYQSAMSMLNFHINRSGRNLSPTRKRVLNAAKKELRAAFHRSGQ